MGNSYAGIDDSTGIVDPSAREEGTSGANRPNLRCWAGIETKLKKAIVDLRNLEKPASVGVYAGMANKKAFFERVSQPAQNQAAVLAARLEVDRLRYWLRKEGVTAQADGTILSTGISPMVVMYDHDIAGQSATMVHISGGKLYTDPACMKPLDTQKMVTHFSGPGKAIFVMSQSGNIHVDSHVVGHRHHSSLLEGMPVACAGELEVHGGTLKWLSNKSGHYNPNIDHLLQILHMLQKKLVPLTFALTVFMPVRSEFPTVMAFMQHLQLEDLPDYELAKLLQYTDCLDDATLGANNWRWRVPHEAAGVYDKTTNAMIPHKVVRQWLKGQMGPLAGKVNTALGTGR
jgi:hypothetical protein